MSETVRPDGARIHYEVHGEGFPVLLLADGAAGGETAAWEEEFLHPVAELAGRFRVITVDQRNTGRSTGPLAPFSYATGAEDLVAVLDDLGVEAAHVVAAGTGTALAWRLAHDAPGRVRSVVALRPVGLGADNTLGDFLGTYDEAMRLPRAEALAGVVEAARREPRFDLNPGAGPYARRLADDQEFRDQVGALRRERYVVAVVRHRDGIWPKGAAFFSVPDAWFATLAAPLLVLPGADRLHPEDVAKRLASEVAGARLVDPGYDTADRRTETVSTIVSFLDENTPR
ncbi:alpha/beta hydrolase [Streptomyces sp. NPDC001941]|uniref:alpha/beta fold hydrolase n=1 Tax=Streptomyces sp. NPDC001941 TaxID=3154659 RepID=UPI0033303775